MNTLRDVFRLLNEMRREGAISDYAIGGAFAITFYTQPVATDDLDVFVVLPREGAGPIVLLTPIYSWLQGKGFSAHGEFVLIHGVPVQFLVAGTPLAEEAIRTAIEHDAEGVPVRVMAPEHLAALYLEAGSARRVARTAHLLEMGTLDLRRFRRIVEKYKVPKRGLKI